MLTPTTTESTGLPTPAGTDHAVSDVEGKSRPTATQTKSAESTARAAQTKTPDSVQINFHAKRCGSMLTPFRDLGVQPLWTCPERVNYQFNWWPSVQTHEAQHEAGMS
jgi:hypothetical protein